MRERKLKGQKEGERERERKRDRKRERESERDRDSFFLFYQRHIFDNMIKFIFS